MGKIKEIYTETLHETENLNKEELIKLVGDKNLKIKSLKILLEKIIKNEDELDINIAKKILSNED